MSATATKAPVFYCTEYVVWPAPEIGDGRFKGKPTPTCWQEFPTFEARAAHYVEAHADFMAVCNESDRARMLGGDAPAFVPPVGPPRLAGTVIEPPADRWGRDKDPAPKRGNRPTATAVKARPNKFAGPCGKCGHRVAAEAGTVSRVDDAWVTFHAEGECSTEPAPAAAPKPAKAVEVADGYYAVEADAGHLSFYRVKAGRKPGIIFVDLLLGGGTGGTLTPQKVPFRNIPPVLAKIAVDPLGAMELFGQSIGRCGVCNRGLTDQVSRDRGIGPECARNMS